MPLPSFGIVTPSFNSLGWLPLAVASVADQAGSELVVHHHVQDGQSTDGTPAWLAGREGLSAAVAPDRGMYDAINQGLDRVPGDLLAYLNCDEQYLPGALHQVAGAFAADPALDLVFADALVVDAAGALICRRHVVVPSPAFVQLDHLPTFTGAMFFRRRVFHDLGLRFDLHFRAVADAVWVIEALRRRLRYRLLRTPTTAFTDDGKNLCLQPVAQQERAALAATAAPWARRWRWWVRLRHRLQKAARGAYLPQSPLSYAIYTSTSPDQRVHFHVPKPATIWKNRR